MLTPRQIAKLRVFGDHDFQESIAALQAQLTKTKGFTGSGSTQQFQDIRQASGELRTLQDLLDDPDVIGVKILPSSSEGASPDFVATHRTPDASGKTERRREVRNVTLTSPDLRPDPIETDEGVVVPRIEKSEVEPGKFVVVRPTTKDLTYGMIKTAIREKVTPKVDRNTGEILKPTQFDAQNANTRLQGRPIQTGGDLVIEVHGAGEVEKAELDKVVTSLQGPLGRSSVRHVLINAFDKESRRGPNEVRKRQVFEYELGSDGSIIKSRARRPVL